MSLQLHILVPVGLEDRWQQSPSQRKKIDGTVSMLESESQGPSTLPQSRGSSSPLADGK